MRDIVDVDVDVECIAIFPLLIMPCVSESHKGESGKGVPSFYILNQEVRLANNVFSEAFLIMDIFLGTFDVRS